jgi:hypothetical protein
MTKHLVAEIVREWEAEQSRLGDRAVELCEQLMRQIREVRS